MSAYISNSAYLTQHAKANSPLIGWQNVLTTGSITATSSLDSRPVINLWNPDTSSVWESGSTSEQYVTLENGGEATVDYIGIAKHNFGSGDIHWQLQSSQNGSDWDDITVERSVSKDTAILVHFDSGSAAFYRIRLVPQGSVAPVIAHVKMGEVLALQRRIYVGHNPATLIKHSQVITNGSENGQFLGKIVTRQWHQTQVKQENNTPEYVRSHIVPFIDHAHTGTFFFAWRPVSYPEEVVYGWTDDNIHPSNQRPNGMMDFSFNVQAVV